jgi:N-acetylneuraminic acid mutarotase
LTFTAQAERVPVVHSPRSPRVARACLALLLSLLALAAVPAGAAADSWTRTGSLVTGRLWHSVTLLPNGQVLAAGGTDLPGFNSTATSERWDPTSGQWLGTPSFTTPRDRQGASLLPDGRVLMTGGQLNTPGADGVLNSALAYDPIANAWSSVAAMPRAHANQQQVTLQDGRVLVIGGFESLEDLRVDGASDQAELYDPAAGTWRTTASTPYFMAEGTATLLQDGSVLVAGGASSETRRRVAMRYFPATNSWRAAGSFTDARAQQVAALLPNGKVLIAGGYGDGAAALRSASVYDPATNSWTEVAPMATARAETAAVTLPNGKVLVAGGAQGSLYFKTAELFDPATNTWSPAASMGATRGRYTPILLADGRVLAVGGEGIESDARTTSALSSAEIYTPDGWPFPRGGGGGGSGGGGTGGGGAGGGTGGGPGAGGTPTISRLALSATRFRAAGSGPSVTTARKRRAPVGTTISYRDAAAGTATFAVQKPASGRRANGRCARPTRANRRKARCTRWVTVGRFTHADAAGPNTLRFSGRVNGHKLSPGRYRLSVTARVGGGTPSTARTIGFRIVG